MNRGLGILPFLLLQIITQLCFADAGRRNGLILGSGDYLQINTSTPTAAAVINGRHVTYDMTFESGNVTGPDSRPWPYTTAVLSLERDVVLGKGSIVNITGLNGLSIRSTNGSIRVSTIINMTCRENVAGKERCLGGYPPRAKQISQGDEIISGNGPGMNHFITVYSPLPDLLPCLQGAGHGGKGGAAAAPDSRSINHVGWYYAQDDIVHLIGGSSGSQKKRRSSDPPTSPPGSGGGAVELQAQRGTITIDSRLTASAQELRGTREIYSGSSGGTIRLRARKVTITENGRLEADGGSAGTMVPSLESKGLAGGSGGVIQIIAERGLIAPGAISLKPGNSNNCTKPADQAMPGFLLIRDLKGIFMTSWNNTTSFPSAGNYTWDNVTASYEENPTTVSQITGDPDDDDVTSDLERLQKRATEIKSIATITETEKLIRNVSHLIRDFRFLINSTNMTSPKITKCLDIMASLSEVYAVVAVKAKDRVEPLATSLCQLADGLLQSENAQGWLTSGKVAALSMIMESITLIAARTARVAEFVFVGSHFSFQAIHSPFCEFNGVTMPNDKLQLSARAMDYIVIPRDVLTKHTGNITISFHVYKDIAGLFPRSKGKRPAGDGTVFTQVITCSLLANDQRVHLVDVPVALHFKSEETTKDYPICVYWNNTEKSWSKDGVTLESHNVTNTTTHAHCKTNHLTSFAVLTQFTKIEIPPRHVIALEIITYIGCGMSIATLFITLLVFSAIESLSTDRHRIHMNLTLSILLSQSVFLLGINATQHEIVCRLVAVVLHYLFSASFTWMCIEGFHLYMKVVTVFRADNIKLRYYYVFGWGFPAIIVGIAASVNSSGYGTQSACWLSFENGFIWAFLGPVVAIMLVNIVIMVMVVKIVISSAAASSGAEFRQVMAGVKGALVLLPLLGVTWVFGLLAVTKETIVFQYVFAISNSLQGFSIFIFHCIGSNEVRAAIKRFRQKHTQTSDLNSTFSVSHGDTHPTTPNSKKQKLKDKVAQKIHRASAKVVPLKETQETRKSKRPSVSRVYHNTSWELTDNRDVNLPNSPELNDDERMNAKESDREFSVTRRHSKQSI